jgi:hypothetical protein
MNSPRHRTRKGFAAIAAMLLAPVLAFASEDPVNQPPADAPVQEIERIVSPESAILIDGEPVEVEATALQSTPIEANAEHRAASFTDANLGLPAGPITAGERSKLDMARAAIEASRAAGTLLVTELPEDTIPATEAELQSMKMQQLEARGSVAPAPDPFAGIGPNIPSVQEVGPSGLSEYEQAKLRGENPPPPLQEEATSSEETPVGDGAPSASDENSSAAMKESSNE